VGVIFNQWGLNLQPPDKSNAAVNQKAQKSTQTMCTISKV